MCRHQAFATLGIAACAPFFAAQGLEPLVGQVSTIEEAVWQVRITLEGIVFTRDGAPAEDALVVSSAGGKAVTERNGRYRLEAEVPTGAQSVWITALAEAGNVASTRVDMPAESELVLVSPLQLAQGSNCQPGWLPTFGPNPGTDLGIHALAVFDGGGGPELYAGGDFAAVGGVLVNRIAKWDGSSWSALGSGVSGGSFGSSVAALTVFDDGDGPALYAAGGFTTAGGIAASNIAKWDGATWTALGDGLNHSASALTVYDDGSGPALYAGGTFTTAGGLAANRIAKWDGSSWSALGSGISGGGLAGPFVAALTGFDDGNGPALYVGGAFAFAGGVVANRVAKWDGSGWSAVGIGMTEFSAFVMALRVYDDGTGPALYAGGQFRFADNLLMNNVAKWDGSGWAALSTGLLGPVVQAWASVLTVFDDGSGSALYVGGNFGNAGGIPVNEIAKWDGSSWMALTTGLSNSGFGPEASVSALTVLDGGSGPALYVGGNFTSAGGVPADNVAKWQSSSWTALGSGLSDPVHALTVLDDGNGSALYAGGEFLSTGGVAANRVAMWNGSSWQTLGSGTNSTVHALTVFDDGRGPALFAGGIFSTAGGVSASSIAKWDGSSWAPLGSGITQGFLADVQSLTVFDDGGGPALYAGGSFSQAGGIVASSIARWDGTTWSALGSGLIGGFPSVLALAVFDDGSGPALYAGGNFGFAGGLAASRIAKWNGSSWSAVGGGMVGPSPSSLRVRALAVFDDGSGPALYAGGSFTTAGGVVANNIAKWDGASWAPLGSGLEGISPNGGPFVGALTVFDDGCGPALYVEGCFTTAGGVAANNIARWDGSQWSPLGGGLGEQDPNATPGSTLAVFNDGTGPALYVGGTFQTSESGDSYLAKWGSPDTTAPVITCPAPIVIDDRPVTPPGEVVTFVVIAKDEQDPTPSVECHPPSGSHFPRGTTLVVCTATDAAGNSTSCQFTVTVGAKAPEILSPSPQPHR